MTLSDGIIKAYETKWSLVNHFHVEFGLNSKYFIRYPEFGGELKHDSINLNIISVQTPELSNTPIETFIGNRWRIQNSRDNVYRFSITFRDMNEMKLYRIFKKIYNDTKEHYFDNIKMSVSLYKSYDDDRDGGVLFMQLNDTIIDSVSGVTFSNNTQNEIAEFTVNFKCVAPQI